MFLKIADLDGDERRDVIVTTRNRHMDVHSRADGEGIAWKSREIPLPLGLPHGKSLAIVDVDGDSRSDVVSTNRGAGEVRCVAWQKHNPKADTWLPRDIGGPAGRKFDLIEAVDFDGDGDLDILTCEEAENLGVIWFENPRVAK